jgi:hypothetical protein
VFLGSSVSKKRGKGRDTTKTAEQERSDVATVVAFLKRFLEDRTWAVRGTHRILKGESGFTDQETRQDLFAPHLPYLREMAAEDLYRRIAVDVFHGRGGLEVWELKGAEGELALRVSAPEGKDNPYFGVVNIGDVATFKRHLEEQLKIQVGDAGLRPLSSRRSTPASPTSTSWSERRSSSRDGRAGACRRWGCSTSERAKGPRLFSFSAVE